MRIFNSFLMALSSLGIFILIKTKDLNLSLDSELNSRQIVLLIFFFVNVFVFSLASNGKRTGDN